MSLFPKESGVSL